MADITKCINESCQFKNHCYRHTAEDGIVQSYSEFKPEFHEEFGWTCDYFYEICKEPK